MQPKKKKTTEKAVSEQSTSSDDKYVVLRDVSTNMLIIIKHSDILTTGKNNIKTGKEVSYKTSTRDGGRGTLLLISKSLFNIRELIYAFSPN